MQTGAQLKLTHSGRDQAWWIHLEECPHHPGAGNNAAASAGHVQAHTRKAEELWRRHAIISHELKDKFNLQVLGLESSANNAGSLQDKDEESRQGERQKGEEKTEEKKKDIKGPILFKVCFTGVF